MLGHRAAVPKMLGAKTGSLPRVVIRYMEKLTADLDILARVELEIRLVERRLEELRTTRRTILELRGKPINEVKLFAEELIAWEAQAPLPLGSATGRPFLVDPDLSIAEAVELVLRRLGRPAGVQEVAEQVLLGGYDYPDGLEKLKNVIRATLSRELRSGEVFSSESRGWFGLREWDRALEWRVPEREVGHSADGENDSAAGAEAPTADEATNDREEAMD